MRRILIPLAVGVAVAAGLLVYVATASSSYSFDQVAACLDSNPSTTGMTNDVDYLAQTAARAEATDIAGNHATLLQAGPSMRSEYDRLGQAATEQHANLLVVWDDQPTPLQEAIVESCFQ